MSAISIAQWGTNSLQISLGPVQAFQKKLQINTIGLGTTEENSATWRNSCGLSILLAIISLALEIKYNKKKFGDNMQLYCSISNTGNISFNLIFHDTC